MDLTTNKDGLTVRRHARKAMKPALERFLAKIIISQVHDWDSTPCWDWTGHINQTTGYGQLKDDHQRTVNAHAFSFDQYVGDVGPGHELTQGCGRRICCSPKHVYPVKRAGNKKRRRTNER